tara:strand:- start:100168 stop:100689 length:522 start_codon:yes stop_codon:yes gene_type:complete
MKKVKIRMLLVVMTLSLSIAMAQEAAVTLEFDNSTNARDIVLKYIKALQEGDVSTMSAQLATNAMVYGLGGGLDSLNVAQHTDYYTNSTMNYTHSISQDLYLPVKVENNWNQGEWVLTWGTNTLTNKKTGNTITIPYHTVNLLQDGKIIMMRYYYDMLNVLETEGFTVIAPAE